ncbi:B-cell receptor CD22 [Perognathus longimembris pacificus]|uniref:B-cell receptor CD22 n=1 Tax=Perognathus longimembris pacificus TaxID=214514 RepID=UPI00201851CB|nr:B-cell receptor CD22 [Perognathus longimembris pacificus]
MAPPGFLITVSEHLAWSDSTAGVINQPWRIEHPKTLYAWEGACVWIPCRYTIPEYKLTLEYLSLLQDYDYHKLAQDFNGTVLYKNMEVGVFPPQQGRTQFLGDKSKNCTLRLNPVTVQDSGKLGLRLRSGKEQKWMEPIYLNVSKTPLPPRIQLPKEIRESQTLVVTCQLEFACLGYPIQLQWSQEGDARTSVSLSTESVYTRSDLTFQAQWTDHGKMLTCQVKNSSAVLSEGSVQLSVKHTPKVNIAVSPSDATVKEGETVTMTCWVTSSYPQYTTLSWRKDGTPLGGKDTLNLVLPSVTRAMGGKYQCGATNGVGLGLSEELALHVLYAPEPSTVHIHPSPAKENTSVELVCVAPANPPARNFSWFLDGAALAGEAGEKVYIPRVLLRHAGSYTCLAGNSLGTGPMGPPARLDVQYAPKMVEAVIETSAAIREGDPVTLSCHYNSSNPQVTRFEWHPRGPWLEPTPGVLTIPRVAWDAGPVACAACNQWCSWGTPVSLDVQYAPRGVQVQQRPPGELHEGRHVVLHCTMSGARPAATRVQWMRNGSSVAEGPELVLAAITPEDAGTYSCEASNAVGSTASLARAVQVLYAPRKLRVSISPPGGVMEGRKVFLTCEGDANPPVWQFAWFHGDGQDLQFSGPTLRLEPAQVQHSGPYWCQGANRLGSGRSAPQTLTVYYSPETIGRRTAVGIGCCMALVIVAIWGIKLRHKWRRSQSRQGLQESSSSQNFFVRNTKVRRALRSEGPLSTGCLNPMMDDTVSYAVLQFPETDTSRQGDPGTADTEGGDEAVTYSVLQRPPAGDYENVAGGAEEDGVHYSELVLFRAGERPPRPAEEEVDYVTIAQR